MSGENIRDIAKRVVKNGGVGSKNIKIQDISHDIITQTNNESYRILEKLKKYSESPKVHFFGIGFYYIKR